MNCYYCGREIPEGALCVYSTDDDSDPACINCTAKILLGVLVPKGKKEKKEKES